MQDDRQFRSMLTAAKERLLSLSPQQITERAALSYDRDTQTFTASSFGQTLSIAYPSCETDVALEMWHHLTILQYMALADGTPLSGEWISAEMFRSGGTVRGQSFNAEFDRLLQRRIGLADEDTILRAAEALGGKPMTGPADLSFVFSFMPRFPVRMNLWLADDEFPASCRLLFDKNAEHYLEVEAAGTVGGILLQKLEAKMPM